MFNPLTATLIAEIVAEGLLSPDPTIVDLGNQTYGVDLGTLERIIGALEKVPAPARGKIDFPALRSLAEIREKDSQTPRVEQFYRALGFSRYDAIDINSKYQSLVMDLNRDLDTSYGFRNAYDLVVNTGTSEHVFNQAAFLRNAHNLARPGGLMAHVVPFTGYINHGFYNYQPNLFYDLASANGYSVVRFQMADRDEVLVDLGKPSDQAAYFLPYLGLATRNPKNNTFLVVLLRKSSDDDLVYPCQGKYLSTLEGASLTSYYSGQGPAGAGSRTMFRPESPAGRRARAGRVKIKLKRWLLRSLRSASRVVLLRLWPRI